MRGIIGFKKSFQRHPAGGAAMDCGLHWVNTNTRKVVHVVGRVTDEVFSFLGPATFALARSGVEQTVVMIDDARYRHHLPKLRDAANVILAPSTPNAVEQWRAVSMACHRSLGTGPLHAVHLHGLLPCVVGVCTVRVAGLRAPIFYTPHGSRSIESWRTVGAMARLLVRPLLRRLPGAAIVGASREALALEGWKSVAVIENPVSEMFHSVRRREAWRPLIVTGGRLSSPRRAELFAQLAVLLGAEDLRINFNWIGAVAERSRSTLTAANVAVFDAVSDAERASLLAAGWIYVALGGVRGFPLSLAEAMASGLPCVAINCPQYRQVIRDGETGFLCRSEWDMIARIAMLIDSPTLRARIGSAAREEARRRFAPSRFSNGLLAVYADHALSTEGVEVPGARS